jgi:hypothetical protein
MWSKGYHVTDAELRELHSAMDRHDGLFYLAAAAGFVADHKAQGDRLDFGHIYKTYRDQFPFLVGGSDEDLESQPQTHSSSRGTILKSHCAIIGAL